MTSPFDFVALVIAIVISLYIPAIPRKPLYLKGLTFFLIITLAVESAGYITSEKKTSNLLLYNIFSTFEFEFYFWILMQVIKNKTAKGFALYCIFIYPLLVFGEVYFWVKATGFHTSTYAFGCLMVAAFCIYYFLELFRSSHSINLIREPSFWICSGLLFFYSCSFPIFGFANYLSQLPTIFVKHINLILITLNSLLYISFSFAFLCTLNPRKIYIVIIIGAVLALMLVGFIVAILFLYQRRQDNQERELVFLKNQYEGELLRTQLEIQEATFDLIALELHDNIGQVLSVVKLTLSILPLEKNHPAYSGVLNCKRIAEQGNL